MLEGLEYPRKIACKRCRRRKRKCDHERPVCGECRKTRSECIQSSPVKTAVDSPTNYIKSLESHIASLEQYIVKLEEVARVTNPEVVRDHLWLQRSSQRSVSPGQEDLLSSHHQACTQETESVFGTGDVVSRRRESVTQDIDEESVLGTTSIDQQLLPKLSPGTFNSGSCTDFNNTTYIPPFELRFGSFFKFGARASTQMSNTEATRNISGAYDRLYFTNVQVSWPFLQQSQWKQWEEQYSENLLLGVDDWRGFFIDMVRSVGALVAQKFDKGSQHIERSKFYHERAKTSLPHVLNQLSPILHTQTSLLLTMHAMHSECADNIDDYVSKAMMYCVLAGLDEKTRRNDRRGQIGNPDVLSETKIRQQMMRVCYGLDRLIAMAFDRPVSVADELIDTDSFQQTQVESSVLQDELDYNNTTLLGVAETDHRFHLRQIQSKIHTAVERREYHALCQNREVTNLWNSDLRLELDQWKADVALIRDPMSYSSTRWLSNLYNYNALALFPNMNLAVNGHDLCHIILAASDVLRNFRYIQIPDQKSCYTWTALVHQFQAGITLLYCFWAAPSHLSHIVYGSPDIDLALVACSASLAEFALRWESAKNFKAVFELLHNGVVRKGRRADNCAWQFNNELYRLIVELRKGRAHRRVLKLVEEMSGAVEQ